MTTAKIQHVHFAVNDALIELEKLFVPGMKLTFIARLPGNDEADCLITNDTTEGIAALVARRAAIGTN